jgi:hypothetical protein
MVSAETVPRVRLRPILVQPNSLTLTGLAARNVIIILFGYPFDRFRDPCGVDCGRTDEENYNKQITRSW